ncbi:hypothetical protein CI610_00912 [invertebrate metagenome]|uniref:Uncharacterized protein n=1 Tax=invertebrate metagenome TaxID=1711999 RepID=A0A2H9TA18_9ZZZZ
MFRICFFFGLITCFSAFVEAIPDIELIAYDSNNKKFHLYFYQTSGWRCEHPDTHEQRSIKQPNTVSISDDYSTLNVTTNDKTFIFHILVYSEPKKKIAFNPVKLTY